MRLYRYSGPPRPIADRWTPPIANRRCSIPPTAEDCWGQRAGYWLPKEKGATLMTFSHSSLFPAIRTLPGSSDTDSLQVLGPHDPANASGGMGIRIHHHRHGNQILTCLADSRH